MIKAKHELYATYYGMIQRCYNPKNPVYKYYGARGISVCERWLEKDSGFWNFVEDMGDRPEGCTLDRADADGNYCPENCRWATWFEQNANRRDNNEEIGVFQRDDRDGWVAQVMINRKSYSKTCKTKEEAIKWRQDKLNEKGAK